MRSFAARRSLRISAVLAACAISSSDGFAPSSAVQNSHGRFTLAASRPLHMSGFPHNEEDMPTVNQRAVNKNKRSPELSAVAIAVPQDRGFYVDVDLPIDNSNFLEDWMAPVLSTAFLITANTVGASCLVLPDLAAGPGFGVTLGVSIVTYLINLVSGLVMAEVAIKQYESSGSEVASSFKDFADTSFQNPMVSNAIAWVSILTNAGVLAFTFAKAGELGSDILGADPTTTTLGFVGVLGVMMSALSGANLSAVASVAVAGLFASFAGLLLPCLSSVQDPMATLMAPGVADNCFGAAAQAFPILLLSLVYQNIVPSVTKILNYDRQKTTASLALGSFIPLAMYMAWCFANMGGGIDTSLSGVVGPLLTGFTVSTIVGSSVGSAISVAEEFDSFFKANNNDQTTEADKSDDDVFSAPAVAASLAVPLAGVFLGGEDMTVALGLAGSIGMPLLFGLVPVLMAWNQRKEEESRRLQNMVPGGMPSLAALGLASTGFVGQELAHVMGEVASLAS